MRKNLHKHWRFSNQFQETLKKSLLLNSETWSYVIQRTSSEPHDSHTGQQLCDGTVTQSVFKYVEVNNYCLYALRTEGRIWNHCFKSSKDKGKQAASYTWGLKKTGKQNCFPRFRELAPNGSESLHSVSSQWEWPSCCFSQAFLRPSAGSRRLSHMGSNSNILYFILLKALLISVSRIIAPMGNWWVWKSLFY